MNYWAAWVDGFVWGVITNGVVMITVEVVKLVRLNKEERKQ